MTSTTLIELPPELSIGDEASTVEFVEANSVEDFAKQTHISDEQVLNRLLLPGRQFGPYRILGFIAAGGMGEIYAAERITDDGTRRRPVALKVISPEHANDWRIVERFKREASISKAIRSKNVIRVYEFGETAEGKTFLSMELLAGEELFERLCRVRTLPLDELADVALAVLEGLDDIHRKGFIHRDIKPENVFLARQPDGEEVVKILDFGIAKRREERSDPLLSVAGQIYGTPEYLAPEQAINPDVDVQADIYSVGVLLYEASSGSLPFQGETSYSVIAAHQNEPVPALPSSIDPEFAEIVYTALAKNPADRFQSAREMAQVLGRWREQTSWVEELPGVAGLAFDDVFDSQDVTPSTSAESATTKVSERAITQQKGSSSAQPESSEPIGLDELSDPRFYLDEDAPAEEFEKFSVTRAKRSKRVRQKKLAENTSEISAKKARAAQNRAELASRSSASDPHPERRVDAADDPTTITSRKRLDLDTSEAEDGGSRIAQLVTWLAIAAIIAALVWTFYPA